MTDTTPYAVYITTAADRALQRRDGMRHDPVVAALLNESLHLAHFRAQDVSADHHLWTGAPVVIVSATAARMLALGPELPRRGNVIVAATEDDHGPAVAQAAMTIGAQVVAELPQAADWLAAVTTNPPTTEQAERNGARRLAAV